MWQQEQDEKKGKEAESATWDKPVEAVLSGPYSCLLLTVFLRLLTVGTRLVACPRYKKIQALPNDQRCVI